MQSTLIKSIIQELEKVNIEVSIEGTSAEETLRSAYILLNPRVKKKVKTSKEVIRSKKYKKDEAYLLMEVVKDATGEERIRDIRPFKTLETLLKIVYDPSFVFDAMDDLSVSYLYTPNPVRIPRPYWRRYRYATNPEERKKLATRYQLLTDKKILNLSYIVLDIDSPFEEVYPVWKQLVEEVGIKGYAVYKTKSQRFRSYIKVSGTYNDGEKTFKLTPYGIGRNKRRHIINAYEIQYILASYFQKRGLNYDETFVGRINHPVWLEEMEVFGEGKSQLYEIIEGETPFYSLYNRVKKLQKKEGIWTYKGENIRDLIKRKEDELEEELKGQGNKTSQQTQQQKQTKQTAPKQKTKQQTTGNNKQGTQKKIKKSKIKMTDLEKLEEAIESLKRRYKTHRFTKIMLPAVGWGKYLGLEKDTIYEILKKHIPTKRNFSEDFEKAWKYGDPLEFVYGLKLIEGIEIYLKEFWNGNEKLRKELKERFGSEADYYEAERYLITNGYIEAEYRKEGRGRPKKVIKLTQKGIKLIQDWKTGTGSKLKDLLENDNNTANTTNNTPDTDNNLENYFTQYNYPIHSPLGEQYTDITSDILDNLPPYNGLVEGWKLDLYQGNPSIYNPDNPPTSKPTHLSVLLSNQPSTGQIEPPTIQTTHPAKQTPILRTTLLNLPIRRTNPPINPPTKINPPVKLTTSFLNLPTFDKNHYVKQSFITFLFTDTFTFHLSKNPTSDLDIPDIPFITSHKLYTSITNFDKLTKKPISTFDNLSETNSDLSTFDKQPKNLSNFDNISETNYDNSKTISTFDNLSEYDKTIIDETIYDEKPTSENKNLSTFEPIDPDKDKQVKPKKPKDKKDSKAKKSNKEKQKEKPKKNLSGGGRLFTKEARIMALLMGYEKDQMGRAVLKISECIDYFYKKTYNLEAAVYRTFAVYIYLSQKSGWKKVFIPAAALPKFEDESLKSEISKAAWGLLERFKKKQKWQRERQEQKQKQKQKKLQS